MYRVSNHKACIRRVTLAGAGIPAVAATPGGKIMNHAQQHVGRVRRILENR